MLEWNDYRVVLAVQRTGALAAAARQLGINHATVFRQVNAMEARLGAPLFDRHRRGYALTAMGEVALAAAEAMENEVLSAERRFTGGDLTLSGVIRVTAPDDMVQRLLLPMFVAFRARYPRIELEVILDNRHLNLSRREADVAIRPTLTAPETMVGVNIGPLKLATYGAPAFATELSAGRALTDLPWIGWEEGADSTMFGGYFRQLTPRPLFVYRANSLLAQIAAAEAGVGVAVLPCFAADVSEKLQRLTDGARGAESVLWILTHPDLRRAARIKAFTEFMSGALRRKRHLLAGERPAQ